MKGWSLIYEGSVKRVWRNEDDDQQLLFEFTDDYSVFDWGKMPDTIENKGRALACLGAYWFEKLACAGLFAALTEHKSLKRFDANWLKQRWAHPLFACTLVKQGLPHHYLGLVNQDLQKVSIFDVANTEGQIYLSVQPVKVKRPADYTLANQTVYYYDRSEPAAGLTLVPIEMVFRFGMPAGSSLKKRVEESPAYATSLGLSEIPEEGEWFKRPVIEFFTKLEPADRLLTKQEALLISNLCPKMFDEMIELTYAVALALFALLDELGMELWDGKLEFALERTSDGDRIILVDSIGPDELRLIAKGIHLSKELIRQYYRDSDWEQAVRKAKALAAGRGSAGWLDICKSELGEEPEHLSPSFKAVADQLYGSLANRITSLELFPGQPVLEDFLEIVSRECSTGGVINAT